MVDAGGFSAAARRLGRAQSAVTYAVRELESDLGVELFDRSAYRPSLTGPGRALLPRARRVLKEAEALQAQAAGMATGLEPELTLVVDPGFPMARLTDVLRAFEARFPSVVTHLHVGAMGRPVDMVLKREADIALAVKLFADAEGVERGHAGWLDLAPVCAPDHPLAQAHARLDRPLAPDEVLDHLQLVLTDRGDTRPGRDHGVSSIRTWRLADLGAKRAMLLAGVGWGSLPRHMVAEDLDAGRLVELGLEEWPGTGALPRLELVVARRADHASGPGGAWLFDELRQAPHEDAVESAR